MRHLAFLINVYAFCTFADKPTADAIDFTDDFVFQLIALQRMDVLFCRKGQCEANLRRLGA